MDISTGRENLLWPDKWELAREIHCMMYVICVYLHVRPKDASHATCMAVAGLSDAERSNLDRHL